MENIKNKALIRLSKSCIGDSEKIAVNQVMNKEYLGMGEEVGLFEQKLSVFFNRETVCVVNGTAAIHLAIQACGIGIGDEVIVQSLTYVATIQAIKATGATPVLCDINQNNGSINLENARKLITKKTKAIIPVHYAGDVGDLDSLYDLAKEFKLRVIEDAAHAFGSFYKEKIVGSFGDICCFSFDGIKNITSGEGGCVISTDKDILEKVKDARLLGVIKDSENRYLGQRSWEFNVSDQGWRYHMSNIMAAIGIEQLNRHDEFRKRRKIIVNKYISAFGNINGINLLELDYENINMHIFPILIEAKISREEFREKLLAFGIQTGIHYLPNHKLDYFSRYCEKRKFPNTDQIYEKIISIPLHPDLTNEQTNYVINTILKIIN